MAKFLSDIVACNGGEGPEGHPKVYLNFSDKEIVFCPYCSRRFEKDTL